MRKGYRSPQMATAAKVRPVRSAAALLPATRSSAASPEFDLLVACCSDSSVNAHPDRIRKLLSHPLDWEQMLRLVDHHRVVPQVYGALSALSSLLPAQPLDALHSRYQDNARKTLWFTTELIRIVSHLESAGIKALPYKGPILADSLYGEVTQRQFCDLDVLILPADVPKAKATLLALGHSCGPELRQQEEPATSAQDAATCFTAPPDEICWTCSGESCPVFIPSTSIWTASLIEPMRSSSELKSKQWRTGVLARLCAEQVRCKSQQAVSHPNNCRKNGARFLGIAAKRRQNTAHGASRG